MTKAKTGKRTLRQTESLANRRAAFREAISHWKKADTGLLWDGTLTNQSHLYLECDLKFFFNQPSWHAAKRVLELGCGSAGFLSNLANFFPDKHYLGVDIDDKNLAAARERCRAQPSIELAKADIWEFKSAEKYDVIVMRFVLQHLKDNARLLPFLKGLLAPGGHLFVVDAYDGLFLSRPDISSFRSMVDQIKDFQDSHNQKRGASFELAKMAPDFGVQVVHSDQAPCPVFRPSDGAKLTELLCQLAEIVSRFMGGKVDEELLAEELARWSTAPYPYLQLGLHQLVVKF